jgi:hypothetical protein
MLHSLAFELDPALLYIARILGENAIRLEAIC